MRRSIAATILATVLMCGNAHAQDTVKIGIVLPLSGPFTSTGRQILTGARLYLDQNGTTVGGKELELVIKDDGAVADQSKRIVQELITREKVGIIAGFGLTPLAFAAAPLATQAKVPMIVMGAATSSVTEQSPFIIRTSFAQAQAPVVLADWMARNGTKKVVTIVSDFAPGHDSARFRTALCTLADRSWSRSAFHCRTRISHRFFSAAAMPLPMPSSCSSLPDSQPH
jgi:branched-chain amino acid transport system substrate-binding protein